MKRRENGRGYGCTVPIVRIPRDFIEIKCQVFHPLEVFLHNSSHDLLDICMSVQKDILYHSKIGSLLSSVRIPSVFRPRVDEEKLIRLGAIHKLHRSSSNALTLESGPKMSQGANWEVLHNLLASQPMRHTLLKPLLQYLEMQWLLCRCQ